MHYRFTIKELKDLSNKQLIFRLINERQEDCTNIYAPLYQRLQKLRDWVEDNIKEEVKS